LSAVGPLQCPGWCFTGEGAAPNLVGATSELDLLFFQRLSARSAA
jgi:hypothetical protein